jgi:hypothetical protein
LYITANGKHALVENKSIDLNKCDEKGLFDKIFCHKNKKVSLKFSTYLLEDCKVNKIAYIQSVPPFLIKTRGSVLLIYDVNSDHANQWHIFGRPSIVQMLAASGHRTIAVGLEHLWKQAETADKLINRLNLTNVIVILPEIAYTDFDLLKSLANSTKLDGTILILPSRTPPIVTKTVVINNKEDKDFPQDSNAQQVLIPSPMQEGNQEKVMQIFANFIDLIHPR